MKPAPIDPPEIQPTLWRGVRGSCAWDVGANCGQTVALLADRFATTICFEPAAECLDLLWTASVRAANRSNSTVAVKPLAISDHDGTVRLAALPDKISTGQLVTPGTHGMEWSPDWDAGQPGDLVREVACRSIDSLAAEIPPPDFIKVDVEGHEQAVLDGAAGYTVQAHPGWLIEFHSPELYESCRTWLSGRDYTVTVIRHPHYPPGSAMWFQHGWLRAIPTG